MTIGLMLLGIGSGSASGQPAAFPARPITIVVGFTPGGGNDVVARVVGAKVGELLRTSVLVLNRPGANGAVALDSVAKAPPDGYTIILGSSSVLAINPVVGAGSGPDPISGFVGIGTVAMTPQVLAVHPSVPAHTIRELVDLSRQKEVSIASAGIGGLPHLAIELFQSSEKTRFVHVPYRGGAPAATDVVAGHVNGIVMDLPVVQPFVADGRMRAIALLNDRRSPAMPNAATSAEQGAGGLIAVNWYGLLAPAGTPAPVADRLFEAFNAAVHDTSVKAKLAAIGIEPMTSASRTDFTAFLKQEIARWADVAKTADLTSKSGG
ncbi:Bug family tripartite tricarboxylate transporter substrate binding protein [Enterovirga rhinocerotis]|uniref:Bug family tripartite tricarboxylate transporter substrate binding protein n=1 Tax=Enterovirga rhinocerotis TaxID=1339210 RepID=UPI0014152BA0|nr:tripartite tricarboxylate transporter substrate binding protein [Enterovirga rhinocerotis]